MSTTTATASSSLSAAERARKKAEARRNRILAKSADRLDVVSGLTPAGTWSKLTRDKKDDDVVVVVEALPTPREVAVVVHPVVGEVEECGAADAIPPSSSDSPPAAESDDGGGRGARRMAAMRRRRYQSKGNVVKQLPAGDEDGANIGDGVMGGGEMAEVSVAPALVDQKEKRLQEIACDGRPASVAELATMGVTASMVRRGVVVEVDVDGIGGATTRGGSRKAWYAFILPPMKVVPRLVTLLLLLFAGLDLGTQPHRGRVVGDAVLSDGVGSGIAFGGGLIRQVKPSLTRPWECGLGGKVAYMAGIMPSFPPTALPTSFPEDLTATEECIAGGEYDITTTGVKECAPHPPSTGSADESKDKGKVEKRSIFAVDDEFDSHRTGRPKGVDREFDDDEDDYHRGGVPPGVVDPVFRVDLDSLLRNANLPVPIDYAAKVAINFHRLWVRYLWTLPTSLLRYLFALPMKSLGGWLANPPWMLGVALLVRFVTQVLVGNGKSPFSLNSKTDDSDGGGKSGNGNLGNNMDVLGKAVDFVKNYATSSFPRTSLVLGTLMKVMKVDMYVLLCGMLIGLAITPVEDDRSNGAVGIIVESAARVLGDGEL
ncbi:hypothetical protein ACHAXA_007841 [Cyclostephanos tholiformis]|uniref:Uncharacterized protein n=1 Tax=Cyclostephanos tholiformis TaxID=382380 RepID=A0ABD3SCC0_9STRA